MNKNSSLKTRMIVFTGLFAALICIMTMLHIPAGNGYIHIGDSLIYLSSLLLPFPCGLFSGAIGGSLADMFSGYAVYMIPTAVIKALNSLAVYLIVRKSEKIVTLKSTAAVIISGFVTIAGYYLTAVILYGGFKAQLATIPDNIIQAAGSAVLFLILGAAFDAANIKKRLKF